MPKLQNLLSQEELPVPCRYYWIIESANGETSLGQCKYCGSVKEFENLLTRSRDSRERQPANINKYDPIVENIDDE